MVPSQASIQAPHKPSHNDLGGKRCLRKMRHQIRKAPCWLHNNNSCSSASNKIWKQFYRNILCFSDSFNYFL